MSKVQNLSNRLSMLGYNRFEISRIINTATKGVQLQSLSNKQLDYVIAQLEKYVVLGTRYVAAYSK